MVVRVLAAVVFVVLLAGCSGHSATTPTPSSDAPSVFATRPRSATCEGALTAAGLVGVGGQGLGCLFERADADPSSFAAALAEADFPNLPATVTQVHLYLVTDRCDRSAIPPCALAQLDGARGPLRLVVDPQMLHGEGTHGLKAFAAFDGVSVGQRAVVAVTLFPQGPVPDGYSAL